MAALGLRRKLEKLGFVTVGAVLPPELDTGEIGRVSREYKTVLSRLRMSMDDIDEIFTQRVIADDVRIRDYLKRAGQ